MTHHAQLFSLLMYRIASNTNSIRIIWGFGRLKLFLNSTIGAIWPSLSPCTVINPILLTYFYIAQNNKYLVFVFIVVKLKLRLMCKSYLSDWSAATHCKLMRRHYFCQLSQNIASSLLFLSHLNAWSLSQSVSKLFLARLALADVSIVV